MTDSTNDSVDRLRLVQSLLITNFELIRHADRKAQFLLRMGMTLFGVALIGVPPAVLAIKREFEGDPLALGIFIGVTLLYAGCATLLLRAIIHIIRAVKPRLARLPDEVSYPRLTFMSMAAMDYAGFLRTIGEMNNEQILEDMQQQLYLTSQIVQTKYAEIDRAIRWFLGGGVLGVVFALTLIVSWVLVGAPVEGSDAIGMTP
jgi:hypothetical protein